MSHSMLRFVSVPLALSLSLAACADEADNSDPITSQESAAATQAVEGVVVAMAPASGGSLAKIAAAYRASFGTGGLSCATVATDDLTFVSVTFTCTGPLATAGSIQLELTSATKLEASVDLAIGGVTLDGSFELNVPLDPTAQRSFHGELTIDGLQRTLSTEATASWTSNGACVTYSASGNISASGPRGNGSADLEVTARTVCH